MIQYIPTIAIPTDHSYLKTTVAITEQNVFL